MVDEIEEEEEEEEEEQRREISRRGIFLHLLERIPERGRSGDGSAKIGEDELSDLLNFLLDHLDDENIQLSGCEVIYRLSSCDLYRNLLFSLDIKDVLMTIMSRHKGVDETQTLGCLALLHLSSLFRFKASDLAQRDVITCLITAMMNHAPVVELQIAACRALRFMAANQPANKERIRSRSGVELIEHVRRLHIHDVRLVEATDKLLGVIQNDYFSSDSERMLRYIVSDLDQHARVLQTTTQNLHLLLHFLSKSEQDLCMMMDEKMKAIDFCMHAYTANAGVQEVICNVLIAMIRIYGPHTLQEFFPDLLELVSTNKNEHVRDANLSLLFEMVETMLKDPDPPAAEEREVGVQRQRDVTLFSLDEGDADTVTDTIHDIIDKMRKYKFSPVVQEAECSKLKELSLSSRWLQAISSAGGVEATMDALSVHKEERGVVLQACWTLKHLTYHVRNQELVLDANGMRLLLEVIQLHVEDANIMEHGCGAMTNLLYKSGRSRRKFVEEREGFATLLRVVDVHAENPAVALNAVWAVSNVLETNETYQVLFVTMDGVHLIFMVMRNHMSNLSIQYQCFKVLKNLVDSQQLRRYVGLARYQDVVKLSMQRHQENSMMVEMGSAILSSAQQET